MTNVAVSDLPPQPPLFPSEAEDYARRAIDGARRVRAHCDVTSDLEYGEDPHQRLDIYRPRGHHGGPLPVLVLAHGGAWTNGYKEWMGVFGSAVTAAPAILVTISYRLAPVNRYPDPFDDCVAALAWVHQHISEFGGDPARILVGGHSSGGTLFALVASRPDVLEQAGLPRDVVTGCLPLSARFDLDLRDPAPGSTEARHKLMIFTPGEAMERYSPLHHVHGARCPFLIAHGSEDVPELREQAVLMGEGLRAQGVPVRHVVLDGYDHFATALDDTDNPWTRAVQDWLVNGPPDTRSA